MVCNLIDKFDKVKVEEAVKALLEAFGEDVNREGLLETPRRVAGYWEELLEGNNYTNEELAENLKKDFKVMSNPLVVKEIKPLYSHCEHHLAIMSAGRMVVAYIPEKTEDGRFKVIGLSKLPRIADLVCKRLQLQEKIAWDMAECVQLATGSKDIFVYTEFDHACVSARGIKKDGFTKVVEMRGEFLENMALRAEVESMVGHA